MCNPYDEVVAMQVPHGRSRLSWKMIWVPSQCFFMMCGRRLDGDWVPCGPIIGCPVLARDWPHGTNE